MRDRPGGRADTVLSRAGLPADSAICPVAARCVPTGGQHAACRRPPVLGARWITQYVRRSATSPPVEIAGSALVL